MRIAVIYDDHPAWGPVVGPMHLRNAIRRIGHSVERFRTLDHVLPRAGQFDVLLFADDSEHFPVLPGDLRSVTIAWATDTHAGGYHLRVPWLMSANVRFAAQLDAVRRLHTIEKPVSWLPWAADKSWHADDALEPVERARARPVTMAFLGTVNTTARVEGAPGWSHRSQWLFAAKRCCHKLGIDFRVISGAFGPDAFDCYRHALLALNVPVNKDLNMRAFEIMAGGAYLVTAPCKGLQELGFEPGLDYAVFSTPDELEARIEEAARDPLTTAKRAWIARGKVLASNTYDVRALAVMASAERALQQSKADQGCSRSTLRTNA